MYEMDGDTFFKTSVPIDDVDQLIMSPEMAFSIVWLNTSDRPDLHAILAAKEPPGDGYTILTWSYLNEGQRNMHIALRIDMRAPHQANFHVAFRVDRYFDQLATVARFGTLWFVPGPPPSNLQGAIPMDANEFTARVVDRAGHGLFVTLEPRLVAELSEKLQAWKRR